jgi:O-6-methylguanine DNA methyltransferase
MAITVQPTPPQRVLWGTATHPLGELVVGITEDGFLCRTSFLHNLKPADVVHQWQYQWPATTFRAHKIPKTYAKLPILLVGTELQGQICEEIMRVPAGEIATYGQIADQIDLPGRARAVGRACRECNLAPIIPCHRIIAAGGIGGYGAEGLTFKQQLLKAEGTHVSLGKRRG